MWFQNAVFYQISTLDFCGCPKENDGTVTDHRINRIKEFAEKADEWGNFPSRIQYSQSY